jgi:hypothetical protein
MRRFYLALAVVLDPVAMPIAVSLSFALNGLREFARRGR